MVEEKARLDSNWAGTVRQSKKEDEAREAKDGSEFSGGKQHTAFSGKKTGGAESATEYSE